MLLQEKCPKDVKSQLWSSHVEDCLKQRHSDAFQELDRLVSDAKEHPINYNHYFTDTLNDLSKKRYQKMLEHSVDAATEKVDCSYDHDGATKVNIKQVIDGFMPKVDPNMENVSGDEALDSSYAIYKVNSLPSFSCVQRLILSKVMLKTFTANVTTQVVERHIVRGLENILNPLIVNDMENAQVELIAKESPAAHRQRAFLQDRINKLEQGQKIFRSIMGVTV